MAMHEGEHNDGMDFMEANSKFFVCARCGSAHYSHPLTVSYSGHRGEINLALCPKCFEDARNLSYGEIASTARKITDAVERDTFEFNSLLDFIRGVDLFETD